jgi:hypothetical protein
VSEELMSSWRFSASQTGRTFIVPYTLRMAKWEQVIQGHLSSETQAPGKVESLWTCMWAARAAITKTPDKSLNSIYFSQFWRWMSKVRVCVLVGASSWMAVCLLAMSSQSREKARCLLLRALTPL